MTVKYFFISFHFLFVFLCRHAGAIRFDGEHVAAWSKPYRTNAKNWASRYKREICRQNVVRLETRQKREAFRALGDAAFSFSP